MQPNTMASETALATVTSNRQSGLGSYMSSNHHKYHSENIGRPFGVNRNTGIHNDSGGSASRSEDFLKSPGVNQPDKGLVDMIQAKLEVRLERL